MMISVSSDGLAMRMPVSTAVLRRAPIKYSSVVVISALSVSRQTTAMAIAPMFSKIL